MKNFFGQDKWQESYDWIEAFKHNIITLSRDCSEAPFTIDDVGLVMACDEGENDGANWIMAGLLHDGRFFFLSASCDYTGWDCQAGGHACVASSFAKLVRWCMGDEERRRLEIPLPREEETV